MISNTLSKLISVDNIWATFPVKYYVPKILKYLEKIKNNITVIADGAAFGSEIECIITLVLNNGYDVQLFLPESFEYLLLVSDLFSNGILNGFVNEITRVYFS